MGQTIKQNNTNQYILFWLISSADHISGLTGKAGSVVVKLSKNGGGGINPNGTVAEVDAVNMPGLYSISPSLNDSTTLGPLGLYAKDALSDPWSDTHTVVAYDPLDTSLGITINSNVMKWNNANLPVSIVPGYPRVDLWYTLGTQSQGQGGYVGLDWSQMTGVGTAQNLSNTTIKTVSGAVGSISGVTFPANFGLTVIDGSGNVSLAPQYTGVVRQSGTWTVDSSTSILLDAGASTTDNIYNGNLLWVYSGTGAGQTRSIVSYTGSNQRAVIDRAWTPNPIGGNIAMLASDSPKMDGAGNISATIGAGVNVTQWNGTNVVAPNVSGVPLIDVGYLKGTASAGLAGYVGLDWSHITAATTVQGLTGTTIASSQVIAQVTGSVGSVTGAVGSVTGSVGSVTGAVGSVTGNVGGNVVGSTGSVLGAVGSVTGNVGGNVVGSVGSVTGAVGSVTGNVGGSVASVTGNVGGSVVGSVASVTNDVTVNHIKKSTALNNFQFVMVNATTNAPMIGLTVTATRNIDRAGFAACANAVTEIGNGWYGLNLAASDLNGTVIGFRFTGTGASDRNFTVITVG
jgi:hypothetical protein